MIDIASDRLLLIRSIFVICLLFGAARGAEAQVCGALPIVSSNTVQLTYDGAGEDLNSYFTGLNYGRRLGAPVSWLNSSAIQVGGAVLGADEVLMRRLNGAFSVAATHVAGSTAAVCLSSGVDLRWDDWRDVDLSFSYVDIPLVATASAPLRLSERITVSPFVAPAVHAYSANISGR